MSVSNHRATYMPLYHLLQNLGYSLTCVEDIISIYSYHRKDIPSLSVSVYKIDQNP